MIPKIIHYCWFGGAKKPDLVCKCIQSWKLYCPDYEIIEWNETNYNIKKCQYIEEAYKQKKWAFISDYVRLDVLYENGGIYLDTDVEIIKSLNISEDCRAYFGFESNNLVNTGIGFGSEKELSILLEMLNDYHNINFIKEDGSLDTLPCPDRNSHVFKEFGFELNGVTQKKQDIILYSQEWMAPINFTTNERLITKNTFSIHWYSGSWMTPEEIRIVNIEKKIRRVLGSKIAFWVRCRLYNIINVKKNKTQRKE